MKPKYDHGLIEGKWSTAKVSENELQEGWLDPRSKLNEIQSTIGTHEAVIYGPMID